MATVNIMLECFKMSSQLKLSCGSGHLEILLHSNVHITNLILMMLYTRVYWFCAVNFLITIRAVPDDSHYIFKCNIT